MASTSRRAVVVIALCIFPHLGYSFQLKSDVMSGGGARANSAGFVAQGTLSQLTASSPWLSSTGYRAVIGFWHPLSGGPGVYEEYALVVPGPYVNFLYGAAPNPVRGPAPIKYSIAQKGRVRLDIYNILGQRVAALVDEDQVPGLYRVDWTSTTELAAGVYFCDLHAPGFSSIRKMVVVR